MLSHIKAQLYALVRTEQVTTHNATAYSIYMRKNRLVGVAYSKPIKIMGGGKSLCICADIRKHYSQHQLYPMLIEFYEK